MKKMKKIKKTNKKQRAKKNNRNNRKGWSQFGKFVIIGFMNTAINFIVLHLLMVFTGHNEGIYAFIFPGISFSVATVNSFIWNRYWTFKDPKKKKKEAEFKDFGQYMAVTLGGLMINAGITYLISNFIPAFLGIPAMMAFFKDPEKMQNVWVLFANAAATGVSMFWNFLGYKFWVFKE
ncbi:MAG: hypothetical protein GF332_03545 [Candidatus Moranbacteria bacterium]|nr:hypothetical protein [Candidatus Moranbacteria bacterium]